MTVLSYTLLPLQGVRSAVPGSQPASNDKMGSFGSLACCKSLSVIWTKFSASKDGQERRADESLEVNARGTAV